MTALDKWQLLRYVHRRWVEFNMFPHSPTPVFPHTCSRSLQTMQQKLIIFHLKKYLRGYWHDAYPMIDWWVTYIGAHASSQSISSSSRDGAADDTFCCSLFPSFLFNFLVPSFLPFNCTYVIIMKINLTTSGTWSLFERRCTTGGLKRSTWY